MAFERAWGERAWIGSGGAVAWTLALAIALLTLPGCEQRPYPKPPQDPAPPASAAELMGAPEPPPPAQPTVSTPPAPAQASASDVAPRTDLPESTPPAPAPNRAEMTPPRSPALPVPGSNPARTVGPAAIDANPAVSTAQPVLAGQPADPAFDRGAAIATFQAAALKALNQGAQLTLPAKVEMDQPFQVSLFLPTGFAAAIRQSASATGLTPADAALDITAALTGSGFRIEPLEPQSQPLLAGQPTVFHWTVTAIAKRHGSLRADICAAVPAGSQPICIGPVLAARPGFHPNSQTLGAALLALIVGLVVVWLSRGQRTPPSRSIAARRAAREAALSGQDPVLP